MESTSRFCFQKVIKAHQRDVMNLLMERFREMDIDLHVRRHGENVALHDLTPDSARYAEERRDK